MKKFYFGKYHNEPVWRPKRQLYSAGIPMPMQHWLYDSASLTQRIVGCCDGDFQVVLRSQGWGIPLLNEVTKLGMNCRQTALIRQVHLLCNGIPWVFARTVIPPSTLVGKQRRLSRLGQKPLGAVLFADKSMKREPMEVARIEPGQQLFKMAVCAQKSILDPIWGRRSIFFLNGYPLLVSEIFLPDICN